MGNVKFEQNLKDRNKAILNTENLLPLLFLSKNILLSVNFSTLKHTENS